jgi:hypothetical protein
MKQIKNILFTIAMMGIVLIVYQNVDEISSAVKKYLVSSNEPIIRDSNPYTRNYEFISFDYNENYVPLNRDDIKNIYFNVLNNGWGTFTFYCPFEYTTCLYDVEQIAYDNELLSKINNYVHPYNSFYNINTKVSTSGEVSIEVELKYTPDKIEEINSKVNEVLKKLKLDDLSTKDKIKKIHNYIIDNSTYDNEATNGKSIYDSNSAYGNLIEGFSVCSGYSDAMAIFLDVLKIPNLKVSSANHIWNLVLVDGKWLHLDLTWDDTENEKYNNNYFLITKEKLFKLDSKEHQFDESFFLEAV